MSQVASLNWLGATQPAHISLAGRFVTLSPLDALRHGDDLWLALQGPQSDLLLWDYLAVGPFAVRAAFDVWLNACQSSFDPLFFTVIEQASGQARGLLSFMRIVAKDGVIEIGNVTFGRGMQRSPASTEAIYLLARQAFELGYRRLEWKCNALNQRSRRAALRFGFTYEGLFRQHMVVKDQNRDTTWFSIIDREWPHCRRGFELWLAPENFDDAGQQKQRLETLRANAADRIQLG